MNFKKPAITFDKKSSTQDFVRKTLFNSIALSFLWSPFPPFQSDSSGNFAALISFISKKKVYLQ